MIRKDPFRVALRLGAAFLALASLALVLVAVLAPSGPSAVARHVPDPSAIALPDLGLFNGTTLLYGAMDTPGVAPRDLGCQLLTRDGREQSTARMSVLGAFRAEAVIVDGRVLLPAFTVSSYPDGSVLSCTGLAAISPVAVGTPSTFGGSGTAVRVLAAGSAVACAILSIFGFTLTRRHRD